MPGLLFLASDLSPGRAARTLVHLVPSLANRFRVAVGVLGAGRSPFADLLTEAGYPPVVMPIRGPLDTGGMAAARGWVRAFEPDVLHTIGPMAVGLVPIIGRPKSDRKGTYPFIASGVDPSGSGPRGWWIRTMLRGADRIVATTRAEANRYARHGVSDDKIAVIPPGVPQAPIPPDPVAFRKSLGIPENGRLVIAAGSFDTAADLRSAVWAFDALKYTVPNVYLVLIGDGPERGRTERFARGLGFDDYRVRFAGIRSDVPALLTLAEVVWVTHVRGGVSLALEAMAAGKPVVAVRNPELAEIIEDGISGRLAPHNDRVELAAIARELLVDPDLAGRLGAAGRDRAADRYPAAAMTDRYTLLYERTAIG